MVRNNSLKILGVLGFFLLLVISQISCKKDIAIDYNGYNDLLENSPMLLWGSSKEEVKIKYPDVKEARYDLDNTLREYNLNGKIKGRHFEFIDNKLFFVAVTYGNYNDNELDLLKKELHEDYGILLIEDNGTIEAWYIIKNENNEIVFVIDKSRNNIVNCSYINPVLRDRDMNEK
jgi:hypothetical protein